MIPARDRGAEGDEDAIDWWSSTWSSHVCISSKLPMLYLVLAS
jgi:hypothetical protein